MDVESSAQNGRKERWVSLKEIKEKRWIGISGCSSISEAYDLTFAPALLKKNIRKEVRIMCLRRVDKEVTLRKDLIVLKEVEIYSGKELTLYYQTELDKRVNIASKMTLVATKDKRAYRGGFHCYFLDYVKDSYNMSSKNLSFSEYVQEYFKPKKCPEMLDCCEGEDSIYKTLAYIVPKGTRVTIGEEHGGLRVIVTPVLINPRIKK